ncbi:MAG: response regulator transcription factor [Anaerolineales bacterium]|nr:response regulator transcription factor [Anaerolineales bacterium]
MEPANILVIEDDYLVARTIERSLSGDEFHVLLASRGDKGLHLARQQPPDLVILDIIMPDMDGYAVCREMRRDVQLVNVPILFLTAKVKVQDKIAGFLAGGDDYLCKPFNVNELIMRVQAILRRTRRLNPLAEEDYAETGGEEPFYGATAESTVFSAEGASRSAVFNGASARARHVSQLEVGGFVLDTHTYELQTPERGKVRLTPLQFDLLYHLMTHPDETFSPSRLLDEIWDYPSGRGSPDLVRVHIKTLRERIENDPQSPTFICTVPGRGYMISTHADRV